MIILAILAILPYFQRFLPILTAQVPPTPTPIPTPSVRTSATVTVDGTQWGVSTCYIGAVEGTSRFAIEDIRDLGISTYRLYGGMPRWETQDDDGIYGFPSIDQIKADPNIINWAAWDKVMTNPPNGSDYSWDPNLPRWQGNAKTLLGQLQKDNIRTVITLRNRDDQKNPQWAPNPPQTMADWNEWWEHVFALTYWLNVRNHYQVNDFEIHNEPNIKEQGWAGSESDYFTFAQYTHDAIDYVYKTYLPGQIYHIYGPATSAVSIGNGINMPHDMLKQTPNTFNGISTHIYDKNVSPYVEKLHTWLHETGHDDYPIWLTEWGSYFKEYNSVPFSTTLLTNLIRESSPGKDYVYGSHIFSLYDYDKQFTGLIDYKGQHRPAYYAIRMGIRALQGCRPTYKSVVDRKSLHAITTVDKDHNLYLLITNEDSKNYYDVNANLSALRTSGEATMWEFGAAHMDTVAGQPTLTKGHIQFTLPSNGAVLIKIPA